MKATTALGHGLSEAKSLAALIGEQASREAAQVLTDAQERAQRITEAAEAEAESIRAAARRGGEARGRQRAAEILEVAEAESRMRVLRARELQIVEVLAQARLRLANLAARPDAVQRLSALIREGLDVLAPGPIRVRLPAALLPLLDDARRRALGAGRWALRCEADHVPSGGVILETDDGRRRVDNSFDARMHRVEHEIRRLAAARLFDLTPGGPTFS
jgi:V/A-type H+-transporting ATPase subunit E